jgi:hypothetical protein
MRQFSDGSPTSRSELLDALDKLCEAMKHLAQTAESRNAPSIASVCQPECLETSQRQYLSSEFEEPSIELIDSTDSRRFSLVAEDVIVQDTPDLEDSERMFAGRLVDLQVRLGGFLK